MGTKKGQFLAPNHMERAADKEEQLVPKQKNP